MSGFFRRLTRWRAVFPFASRSRGTEDREPVDATASPPAGGGPAAPARTPVADRPSALVRARLRRRLRYLRHGREVMLRDLGGLVFDVHRFGAPDAEAAERHARLIAAKLDRIQEADAEVRDLEARLEDVRAERVIREPGVGGTCSRCGELHSSHARFCSHCGLPLAGAEEHAEHPAPPAPPPTLGESAAPAPPADAGTGAEPGADPLPSTSRTGEDR